MNYIGSKHTLSNFIKNTISLVVGKNLSDKVFCDIFAGTGIVGRIFKNEVKKIMSNYGQYDLLSTNYQRFKADKDENRNYITDKTEEYLHILEKE